MPKRSAYSYENLRGEQNDKDGNEGAAEQEFQIYERKTALPCSVSRDEARLYENDVPEKVTVCLLIDGHWKTGPSARTDLEVLF